VANDGVAIPRVIQSSKDVPKAAQSHSDSIATTDGDVELAVQVRVEQTVSIAYDTPDNGRANRRGPSLACNFRS
jgi:hypothetical protein